MSDETGGKPAPKKRGPKPIEIDLEQVERLASRGLGPTQIARSLGISWSTLDRNRKKKAELDDIIKKGQARGVQMVTDALMESATSGNVTAQIFYLKNRDHENWKDRHDVQVGGTVSISDALTAARGRALPQAYPTAKTIEHEPAEAGRNASKTDEEDDA